MRGALDWLDPESEQVVMSGDGEQLRDEVRQHWMANAFAATRIGVALLAFSTAWLLGGLWLLLLIAVALGLAGQALWRLVDHYRHRFLITDRRVIRIRGNLNQVRHSLPMTGISGIEVERSLLGKVFGYGRLRLHATANDRALTEVRWVPDVDARAQLIRSCMAEQLASAS